MDGEISMSSVGVSKHHGIASTFGWFHHVSLRYRRIWQSQVLIQRGSWGPEVIWMVEGTFKQKQIVKQAGRRRHAVWSGAGQQQQKSQRNCGSWHVHICDALTVWGMIGIGHAWAIMIPFPLMKPLCKHTHAREHPRSTSAEEVREDDRRVCFKIKHSLHLQGCFFSWLECTIPDASLFGLHANTIACFIYSSIINKPWHPPWTYSFFSQSDCQNLFFWRYCGATIFQSSQRCASGVALEENLSLPSKHRLRTKPAKSAFGRQRDATKCHSGFFCFSLLFSWPPLLKWQRFFTCHSLYSKTNLLHLNYNPPSVTVGPSVSLEDGYGGACPLTHAINFSSKVKPCWCCC